MWPAGEVVLSMCVSILFMQRPFQLLARRLRGLFPVRRQKAYPSAREADGIGDLGGNVEPLRVRVVVRQGDALGHSPGLVFVDRFLHEALDCRLRNREIDAGIP